VLSPVAVAVVLDVLITEGGCVWGGGELNPGSYYLISEENSSTSKLEDRTEVSFSTHLVLTKSTK
jgi:hypothetical protein